MRLIKKGEGFPSNLVMTSLKMYFYTAALYICILVHTKLGPSCSNLCSFIPIQTLLKRKTLLPEPPFSIITIYAMMKHFLANSRIRPLLCLFN